MPKVEAIQFASNEIDKEIKIKARRNRPITTPVLKESKAMAINSFVSIHLHFTGLAWSRFTLHRSQEPTEDNPHRSVIEHTKITHWHQSVIENNKMHLSDLVQLVLHLVELIPQSDVYLIENPATAHQSLSNPNASQIRINVQKAQTIAMLAALLANRVYMAGAPIMDTNVYFLQHLLCGRYEPV